MAEGAAKDLAGKVVVANFIFTSCPTVCPTLTAHMARIQQRFAKTEGVHLLSFSVDPKNDTPEKLAAFAKEYGQDPARWTFLTGDIQAVEKAIVEGFKIHIGGAGDPEATAFDIVHGALGEQKLLLLDYCDAQQRITERVVMPLGLFFWGNAWLLAAWCTTRSDYRSFRLDRCRAIRMLDDHFHETPDRSLNGFLRAVRAVRASGA